MRGRWIVLLLMLPQWAAAAPESDAPNAALFGAAHTLVECAQHASPDTQGLHALGTVCPGIESATRTLGLDALLPSGWAVRISARALADLGVLAERYALPAPQLTPIAPRLRAIATGLKPPEAPAGPLSWWQRLKAWIAHWLESG